MVADFKLREENKNSTLTSRGYPLPAADKEEMQKQIEDLEKRGFIEEVPAVEQPSIVSPAFLVDKADGSKRLVVDYSRLNKLVAGCALSL